MALMTDAAVEHVETSRENSLEDHQYLLRLVDRPRLLLGAGPGVCWPVPGDVSRVPAAAEAGQLFDRPGDGEVADIRWLEVSEGKPWHALPGAALTWPL